MTLLLAGAGRASAQWEQDQIRSSEALVRGAQALQAPRGKTMDGMPVKIVIEETATSPIFRLTGALKLTVDQTVPCGPMMCTNFTVNRYTARLKSEAGKVYRLDLDLFELGEKIDGFGIVGSVEISGEDGTRYRWECPEADAPVIIACGYSALTWGDLLSEDLPLDWTRPSPAPASDLLRVSASFHLGEDAAPLKP